MTKLTCNRCGHVWFPRSEKLPVECPACKSRYWDKERIERQGGNDAE